MTEGEILALEKNGRTDLTLDDYFEIVVRKTAALFAGTCRIAGHLVDLPEASRKALFDYGHNLGVCFQLIDDLLDFTSSTEVLGKPVVSDLKEGKLTLPLILALPHATGDERRLVERIASDRSLGSASPADVIAIANKYDGIAETRKIAREYAARARAALATFAPSPAREALEFALEFVMSRDR
jgi:octaprenyl-diphosphate synthase